MEYDLSTRRGCLEVIDQLSSLTSNFDLQDDARSELGVMFDQKRLLRLCADALGSEELSEWGEGFVADMVKTIRAGRVMSAKQKDKLLEFVDSEEA